MNGPQLMTQNARACHAEATLSPAFSSLGRGTYNYGRSNAG